MTLQEVFERDGYIVFWALEPHNRGEVVRNSNPRFPWIDFVIVGPATAEEALKQCADLGGDRPAPAYSFVYKTIVE